MTNTNNSVFMADFANRDRRSAHAHLRGTNLRVHAFNTFAFLETMIGRKSHAASDYKRLSALAYRNTDRINTFKRKIGGALVALVSVSVGAAITFHLLF